jgi:outer membrane immunogenic protein
MKLSTGILGLTLSSVVALASANAADMYAPGPGGYKDFGPIAIWSGFYAGVNGGYAWGTEADVNATQYEIDPAASATADGAFGGGQIGYNIQRDRLVYGLEADFQGAGVTGSANAATSPDADDAFATKAQTELDWFGTVRGRLGLTFPDDAGLIYITAGFAYGGLQHKLSGSASSEGASQGSFSLSSDRTSAGWVLGAGYERFITHALSLKVEYQFMDLGSETLCKTLNADDGPVNFHATYFDNFSTVRVGVNYHLAPGYEPLK